MKGKNEERKWKKNDKERKDGRRGRGNSHTFVGEKTRGKKLNGERKAKEGGKNAHMNTLKQTNKKKDKERKTEGRREKKVDRKERKSEKKERKK